MLIGSQDPQNPTTSRFHYSWLYLYQDRFRPQSNDQRQLLIVKHLDPNHRWNTWALDCLATWSLLLSSMYTQEFIAAYPHHSRCPRLKIHSLPMERKWCCQWEQTSSRPGSTGYTTWRDGFSPSRHTRSKACAPLCTTCTEIPQDLWDCSRTGSKAAAPAPQSPW